MNARQRRQRRVQRVWDWRREILLCIRFLSIKYLLVDLYSIGCLRGRATPLDCASGQPEVRLSPLNGLGICSSNCVCVEYIARC